MVLRLHDPQGRRLYVTGDERERLLEAVREHSHRFSAGRRTFIETLVFTGCRPSEALGLSRSNFDFKSRLVTIPCAKKRRPGIIRAVPAPREYLDRINLVHPAKRDQNRRRLWPFCRATAHNALKAAMTIAGIQGPQASAKGLRHGFAVQAVLARVPLPLLSRWLGHANLEMTSIYLQVTGGEEITFADRMWTADGSGEGAREQRL